MKTTAKILWGLGAVALGLSATMASANPTCLSMYRGLTLGVVSQTSPADARRQSDDLLSRARQAIDEGHFDVAGKLIERAESLGVRYNPLSLGDTPSKLRHELERKQGSSSGFGGLLPKLPFGDAPQGELAPDPFNQGQASPPANALPSSNGPANGAGFVQVQSAQTPGNPADRVKADGLLLQARRALAVGDVRRAAELTGQAKGLSVSYGPKDDTPDIVATDIQKYHNLRTQAQGQEATEGYRRQLARLMMEQAEALLRWNDFNEAERLVNQARDQRVQFGPMESNPNTLLQRISEARKQQANLTGTPLLPTRLPAPSQAAKQKAIQLLTLARGALSSGNLAAAEAYARAANDLQVPMTEFAPGEDRPDVLLSDIQKARYGGASRVVQAGAVTPAAGSAYAGQTASPTVYDNTNDPTRNIPAGLGERVPSEIPRPLRLSQLNPRPAPAMSSDMPLVSGDDNTAAALFRQGEAALKERKVDEALNYYRQAARYRNQLDPATAQLLQDRLQLLSSPGMAGTSQAPTTSMADEAMAKQQLLARQVNADVANQERRARQLLESDPKTALNLLQQARMRAAAAGLEPNAQAVILGRVDRTIAEMQQFIQDNSARIELADQNNQTREQIDRQRQHKLEVQQRLAELIQKFNQLLEERRYNEADLLAKEIYDLAPTNPVAQQTLTMARFIRRDAINQDVKIAQQEGFLDALGNVDISAIPFDDNNPIVFPDARRWEMLTASRGRFGSDTRRVRTGQEFEIEQKLRTPISVHFTNAPLAQVLDQLQQLANVNIYLDPQGLQEEGVASDSPVTINLPQEISLKSALTHILEPLHLTFLIKDEVLKITSEHYSDSEVYIVTYDVADLVVPIPNFVPNARMGLGGAYNEAMGRNGFNNAPLSGGTPPLGFVSANDGAANTAVNAATLAQQMPGGQGGSLSGMPNGYGPGGLGGGSQADFDPLIRLITSTIKPESWTEFGGSGTIEPYENNLTLVIKTTEEVHAEIVDVLNQLRRLQDLQVTIEVRFITLNDDFFESIRVDFDFDIDDDIDRALQGFGRVVETTGDDDDDDDTDLTEPTRDTRDVDHDQSVTVGMSAPGVFSADLDIPFTQGSYDLAVPQFGGFDATAGASLGFAILSDIEAYFFINAAQGDSRTNILQAPKVTLFNGQQAHINDTSSSPFVMGLIPVVGDFAAANQPVIVILSEGTSLTVQAVVSADRRFVRLTVVPMFSQIGDVNTFTFSGRTTTTTDTSTEGPLEVPDDSTKQNDVTTTTTEGTTVQLPTFSQISVSTTVSVPDGGTVLLGGIKRLREGRSEYGVPILNKIPYVNRLFQNVGIGRETQSLMMTVTPRIIIQEEEEERIGAGPSGP